MNEKAIILSSSTERDIQVIERIYQALANHTTATGTLAGIDDDTVIVVAYYLHHLYNAFENIFQNIAAFFENSVDEKRCWHAQLLERMNLDALPLRPKVIDAAAYNTLDELRRFRHVFRHAYGVEFDAERLILVLRKALILKDLYRAQFASF